MKRIAVLSTLAATLLVPGAIAAEEAPPLKIGLAAMISPKETLIYYNSMLGYVGQKIGRRVEMVQMRTYDEMDLALEKRDLDVAFVCAGPYVKDRDRFGAELLVAPQSHGKPFYHAYILVPIDSAARSLADLKGKSFAFTDPKSNTGKLVPSYMVAKAFDATPEQFFGKVSFTYSHDKSIEAVANHQVDGASVDSLIFDYLAAKSPAFTQKTRIIAKSPPYGIPPVIVNRGIDPTLKAQIKKVLLEMHQDSRGRGILESIMIEKFVVPKDKDYDSVREMERWIAKNRT